MSARGIIPELFLAMNKGNTVVLNYGIPVCLRTSYKYAD